MMDESIRAFAQQQFVRQVHQMILPVFAQPGDELKPWFKEQLPEGSRDVAAIPKQLATPPFDHARHRSAIIDIAWSQTTRKPLASTTLGQVQLKPKEPAHRSLATFGIGRKDAVLCDSFGITDTASKSSQ